MMRPLVLLLAGCLLAGSAAAAEQSFQGTFVWNGKKKNEPLTMTIQAPAEDGTMTVAFVATWGGKQKNYSGSFRPGENGMLIGTASVKGSDDYLIEAVVSRDGSMQAEFFVKKGEQKKLDGTFSVKRQG